AAPRSEASTRLTGRRAEPSERTHPLAAERPKRSRRPRPTIPRPESMEKPQDSPAVVSDVVNATFGIWFPFFRWMTRNLPPVWVKRLAAATAERAIWAREHVREAVLDNYAQILGAPNNSRRVEALAKEMISRHSRLWIDLLRYSGEGGKDASR